MVNGGEPDVSSEAGSAGTGFSRTALLVALVDRASNDRTFAADLRREPAATAARLGLWLSDCEWNGLRAFLVL